MDRRVALADGLKHETVEVGNKMRTTNGEGGILCEQQGQVLVMTIDRPQKRNALTPKMLWELAEAYARLEANPELRCGLITGAGGHFTAGLDMMAIREHRNAGKPLWPVEAVDPLGLRPPYRIKPIVCAVAGVVFTSGVEIMLAADIVVTSRTARFRQHEVSLGMMAWGGATVRMVERAGWGNAMRILLTGEEFDAEEAHRCGFVQIVCEPGEERQLGLELAGSIARQAPLAVQATIANARKAVLDGAPAAMAELDDVRAKLVRTADAAEGLASFLERRPATFEGM